MTEIVKRKDTSLSTENQPFFFEISDKDKGKMDYFKTELDRMKGIEHTLKDFNAKYIIAINEKTVYKNKYDAELKLNSQLMTELNILKAYKQIIDLTCFCPDLKKKINIFDCNRGYNNYCRNKKDCSLRRLLLEDIKNKYLD